MANTESAKKRIRITAKKTLRNKMIKSRTKTFMKKVVVACTNDNKDDAKIFLKDAISQIDKAACKGIYHKNNAARKKSKLTKLVNRIVSKA